MAMLPLPPGPLVPTALALLSRAGAALPASIHVLALARRALSRRGDARPGAARPAARFPTAGPRPRSTLPPIMLSSSPVLRPSRASWEPRERGWTRPGAREYHSSPAPPPPPPPPASGESPEDEWNSEWVLRINKARRLLQAFTVLIEAYGKYRTLFELPGRTGPADASKEDEERRLRGGAVVFEERKNRLLNASPPEALLS